METIAWCRKDGNQVWCRKDVNYRLVSKRQKPSLVSKSRLPHILTCLYGFQKPETPKGAESRKPRENLQANSMVCVEGAEFKLALEEPAA